MESTKSYYPNGQLESEGFVNEQTQVGTWRFYHENGKLFSQGQFENGTPTGVWIEFYENGQIKYEAISPQGNWFSFDNEELQIINYWTEDGIQLLINGTGKLTTFFDNGNIEHVSYWVNRLKEGTFQEFYNSGQLKVERNYTNGIKNGFEKLFYENGNLRLEYFYQSGNPFGKYEEWYESGQLSEKGEFVNGDCLVINFWTEEGEQILKEGTGKVIRKYGSTGGDIYEQFFDKGKMTSEKKIAGVIYGEFTSDQNNSL